MTCARCCAADPEYIKISVSQVSSSAAPSSRGGLTIADEQQQIVTLSPLESTPVIKAEGWQLATRGICQPAQIAAKRARLGFDSVNR
jgi:hypothetical protein